LWYIDIVIDMEGELETAEKAAQEGLPEREPETIGEALKKYYEEQLSHSGLKTETGRKAFLLKLLADHSMALN